jgi:hypothetical protein
MRMIVATMGMKYSNHMKLGFQTFHIRHHFLDVTIVRDDDWHTAALREIRLS